MKKLLKTIACGFMTLNLLVPLSAFASEVTGDLSPDLESDTVGGTVVVAPDLSPDGGTFTSARSVTMTAEGSSRIYYTVNGDTPSCGTGAGYTSHAGTQYTGAVSVSATHTVKAIACYLDDEDTMHASSVTSVTYTLNIHTGGGGGGGGGGSVPGPTSTPTTPTTPSGSGPRVITIDPAQVSHMISVGLHADDLVKLADDHNPATQDDSAVYYVGADGKRHAFPNASVYYSWFCDFSKVQVISAEQMASIHIGANVTYRPGIRLVKFPTINTVYLVKTGGVLVPVADEATAKWLAGNDWAHQVSDINEAFFTNYWISPTPISVGGDISSFTAPSNISGNLNFEGYVISTVTGPLVCAVH